MRRLLVTVAATAMVFGLSSATASAKPKGWDHKPAGSIVDVAVKASSANGPDTNPHDYDLLIAAVTATGLAPVLDDESQTFTVFAPNDRAFRRLVRDLTDADRLPSEADALAAVLATFSADQIKHILLDRRRLERRPARGDLRGLAEDGERRHGSSRASSGSSMRPRRCAFPAWWSGRSTAERRMA